VAEELITRTEFARRVGRSRQRIAQLLAEGRLPLVGDRIPWAEGKAAWDIDHAPLPEGEPADLTDEDEAWAHAFCSEPIPFEF